jgi:aminomethyltransferase
MRDVSDTIAAVGLTGPDARGVMERAGVPVPDFSYLQFADMQWRGIDVTVLRAGEEVKESWQVWIAPENFSALWDALVEASAIPTSASSLNLFRIARGIPQFGRDIRDRDLPQETGQARALNFTGLLSWSGNRRAHTFARLSASAIHVVRSRRTIAAGGRKDSGG